MKKWIINYHLPEDITPEKPNPSSRSYECNSDNGNGFGKIEDKFLKKHPTATIETMRCLGNVEEL